MVCPSKEEPPEIETNARVISSRPFAEKTAAAACLGLPRNGHTGLVGRSYGRCQRCPACLRRRHLVTLVGVHEIDVADAMIAVAIASAAPPTTTGAGHERYDGGDDGCTTFPVLRAARNDSPPPPTATTKAPRPPAILVPPPLQLQVEARVDVQLQTAGRWGEERQFVFSGA